jgi:hypothetical protein
MPHRVSSAAWPLVLLGCTTQIETQPTSEPTNPEAVAPVEMEVDPAAAPEEPVDLELAAMASLGGGEDSRDKVPVLTPDEPVVGTTDKDVIRRVVRSHINEIRDCYTLGLAKDPTLAGRIMIDFTIGPTGAVVNANASDVSGLADPAVPTCIVDAILTWTFPKPHGGGSVNVSYPFNLVPG